MKNISKIFKWAIAPLVFYQAFISVLFIFTVFNKDGSFNNPNSLPYVLTVILFYAIAQFCWVFVITKILSHFGWPFWVCGSLPLVAAGWAGYRAYGVVNARMRF